MTRVARVLRGAGVVGALLNLTACVTAPAGPSLPAMPGSRKSGDQFSADDVRCRTLVHERLAGVTPSSAANQSVAGSAVAGTAVGAATGALIDGSSGAAAGAAAGLVLGTMAGSAASQGAWVSTQQQFDSVYYACMYASGHKVPVPAYDAARYRAWYDSLAPPVSAAVPPPNTAPPSAPSHN
jgi:outer membrane lipoprotein SlyB